MAFEGLKIPDPSFLMTPVQSLPGAAVQGYGQGRSMVDLFNKFQLNELSLNKAKREAAATKAEDQLTSQFPQTPEGQGQVATELAKQGFGQEALAKRRWSEEWAQHNLQFSAQAKELLKQRMASSARFIQDLDPKERPEAWKTFKKGLKDDGYDTSDIPAEVSDKALKVMIYSAMSQKELEAVRHDDEMLQEEKRWHDLQVEMAREKAKNPGPGGLTTAWTDNGLVIVDKRTGTYTPTAPAGGPGGPAQPKPPQVPVQVNTAIAKNLHGVNVINNALSLVENYKKATGLIKGIANTTDLGAAVLNKTDPKGVEARAAISDIGSIIFHDRTGAAVTISEAPRLKPFIPLASDSYKTVKVKLTRLAKALQEETDILKATYPGAGPGGGSGGGASGTFEPAANEPPAGKIWSRVKPK